MTQTPLQQTHTEEEIMSYVKAGLRLAGGDIPDPEIEDILRRQARGEITDDEVSELIDAHFGL